MTTQKLHQAQNTPKVTENGGEVFSLEDILREFGAPQTPEEELGHVSEPPEAEKKTETKVRSISLGQATTSSGERERKKDMGKLEKAPVTSGKRTPDPAGKPRSAPSVESLYRAAQDGLSGRRARLVLSFLLSVLAVVFTCLREWGVLSDYGHQGLLNLGELGILILCALLATDVLFMGKSSPAKQGAGFRLLMAFELVIALVYGFMTLTTQEPGLCAPVCLVLSFGLLSVQLRCRGLRDTMDAARGNKDGHTLLREPDYYKKLPGLISGQGSKEIFLKENEKTPTPQTVIDVYGLLVVGVSVAGAVFAPSEGMANFLKNTLLIALAGTPLCGLLVWARPWSILAERLGQRGAALYGWLGARRAGGKLAVPISDEDLFSQDNMKPNGIKFFGGADPDRVIAYGAAVMTAAGGGLKEIFVRQAELRGVRRYNVTRFRRYESGGVSGEIGRDSILVGTLRFMQSMGVGMPAGTKVSQAVYVAVNGDLAGVFAINYGISRSVSEAMSHLITAGEAIPVITAGDFIVSESFLRSKFRINTDRVLFPSLSKRAELERKEPGDRGEPCVVYRGNRFGVTALAVCGSRALVTAAVWGMVIAILGGILGLGISLVLTLLGTQGTLSVVDLLAFWFLWAVPVWLLSGWPKNV